MIIAAGVLAGVETYPDFSDGTYWGEIVQFFQNVILFVFVIEIFMKIFACGLRPRFFSASLGTHLTLSSWRCACCR